MKQVLARIIDVNFFESDYVSLTFKSPEIVAEAQPGQFVNIRVSEGPHPILRRPISIFDADEEAVCILFKVVGEGTRLLSEVRKGDYLDVIGPIGHPFKIEPAPALLVAGGAGIAPLHFLGRRLRESGFDVHLIYGVRTRKEAVAAIDLVRVSTRLTIVTEDGSLGERGLATDFINKKTLGDRAVYACGPEPMLAALQTKLAAMGKSAQFSLESRMACGAGACQGCAIATQSGYQRVCADGPVFDSDKILKWSDGA
ncbi:MAG TPA: dihydroorotate dehydrogenase electron transfer subunit [Candidatus Sumerlaeota bacterium]|nr:MAG: Dihydroorotate dehydrogenase B (NAD(+)), electron transfer subunit [candidate division BRC1 bacterium ADurb.Bin183]HOE63900.1 dihydroorotate dehydrogenase electron transfer subunit [Candidatus Sumerlaeota bacterium]HRR31588.1 dihydroorotate dehydrogenase electron transfer subunit [Candidatus Sumerlaeia bacterium]HON51186.1 dihydroorotate dehydrogenase electron transfer subunit [Candidatus Sumerlaeota bacterium]HOR64497.1 dihydroorotate dehydrogenase electron transfer subunit [Candidatus